MLKFLFPVRKATLTLINFLINFQLRYQNALRTLYSATNYRSENAVGLGLSFPLSSKKEANLTDRRPAANVREDIFPFYSAVQEKTLRFSLPASETVESAYSDDKTYRRESFRKSYGTGDREADHAKRRASFMDIISDLGDLEVPPAQSLKPIMI